MIAKITILLIFMIPNFIVLKQIIKNENRLPRLALVILYCLSLLMLQKYIDLEKLEIRKNNIINILGLSLLLPFLLIIEKNIFEPYNTNKISQSFSGILPFLYFIIITLCQIFILIRM